MRSLPRDMDVEAVIAVGRYLDDQGSARPVSIHGALTTLRRGSIPPILTGAQANRGFAVTGIDIDPSRFADSLDRLGVEVRRCDIERGRLPFADGSFDCATFKRWSGSSLPGAGGRTKSEDQPHAKADFSMHRSPRRGARTRTGSPCRSPAMPNGSCRMHGRLSPGPLQEWSRLNQQFQLVGVYGRALASWRLRAMPACRDGPDARAGTPPPA
jgi:hypothetical protein